MHYLFRVAAPFILVIQFHHFPYSLSKAEQCFKLSGLSYLTRSDEGYNKSAQQFWTTGKLHRPQGFVLVRNEIDVKKAVECSQRNGVNLVVKSGGHSLESYSFGCNSSWVIDLKYVNTITLNRVRRTVTFGSGLNSKDLEKFLWKESYIVPLGTCYTVGVSGISLGGGIGLVARRYGLTVDQIEELQIVTADGNIRNVSRTSESDLFWALRGAGGGNFGIVTRLTLKVLRPPTFVARVTKVYDNKHAANIFFKWQKYFTSWKADNSIFSEFKLNFLNNIFTEVNLVITTHNETHGRYLIENVKQIFPNITNDIIRRYDNFIGVQYEMSDENEVTPNLMPTCQKSTSFFVSKPLSFEECKRATDIVINFHNGWIYVVAFGGHINRIKRNETAWVHRESKYNVLLTFNVSCDASGDNDIPLKFNMFRFMDNGESYQNFISKLQENYLHRYYGSNLQRLISIKNKYDPQNFFCFPQSIPLTLNDSKSGCACSY